MDVEEFVKNGGNVKSENSNHVLIIELKAKSLTPINFRP